MIKRDIKKGKALLVCLFLVLFLNVNFTFAISDVAYIYKNKPMIDKNILNVFSEMNLSVDLISETKMPSDFSKYKLIFVGDERFKNKNKIPVGNYPTVVSNYYFSYEWGLTDSDGVSKLAASEPLSVRKDGEIIPVYTQATYDTSSISISYYYLANENKAPGMERVATTYMGDSYDFGDVIAYAKAGTNLINGKYTKANLCFFGLDTYQEKAFSSKFWTGDVKGLLKNCINFAGTICSKNSDCPDQNTGEKYCKDGKVYQDIKKYECKNPGTAQSKCEDDVVPQIIENCQYGCLNATCQGPKQCQDTIDNDEDSLIDCADPGCWTDIDNPASCEPTLNNESRATIICKLNTECGTDSFVGNKYCTGDSIYQDYTTYKCDNLGLGSSSCSSSVSPKLVQACSGTCLDATCVKKCVDNDNDGYDDCSSGEPGDDGKPIDCNDNDANIHPNAPEICNGIDDDCDGQIDENNGNCGSGKICSNGQCVNILCNQNSDCGSNYIDGLFCQSNNVFQNYITYTCNNPGTINSACVSTTVPQLKQTCLQTQICSNAQCVNVFCSKDSNCGFEGFVDGFFCKDGSVFQNYISYKCNNPGTLGSTCSSSTTAKLKQTCSQGQTCSNGQCVPVACNSNSDCGTNGLVDGLFCQSGNVFQNYVTYTCNNPGTPQSNCVSTTAPQLKQTCTTGQTCIDGQCSSIACNQDCDCGNDGFVDGLFCKNNNVFQNYVSHKCNNPGTTSSVCTSTTIAKLKQTCVSGQSCSSGSCVSQCVDNDNDEYDNCAPGTPTDDGKPIDCNDNDASVNPGALEVCDGKDNNCNGLIDENNGNCGSGLFCVSGQCKPIKCTTNADCNDNNLYTIDECNNPGTVNSYCSHTLINCANSNDCGLTGFIDNPTCSDNKIFSLFQNSTCVNPETKQSYCEISATSSLLSDCGQDYCDGFGNNYCKDGHVYHSRICYDKGCAQGACSSKSIVDEVVVQTCNFGCNNGQCSVSQCVDNDKDNYDTCNPGQPGDDGKPIDCNDNDASVNPGAVEICDGKDNNCNGLIDENNGNCGNGQMCISGNCVNIYCTKNSDCGTNGLVDGFFCQSGNVFQNYVNYTCNNPNTPQSNCTNTLTPQLKQTCLQTQICSNGQCINILCNQNSDCGANGFIGSLFCSSNNVFQNYITFTCNNPGTISSICTNSTAPQLKQTCTVGQTCSGGSCVNNCVDNDGDTYDTCNPGQPGDDGKPVDCNDNNPNIHPGATEICNGIDDDCDGIIDENNGNCPSGKICSNGQCVNILCNQNSDCGTNGFIDGLFCQSNNVFQKFVTYTCNNPGTILSYCTNSTASQLKQTCAVGQTCVTGTCVQQCKDNDNDGYDNCAPGTPTDDGKPVDCNDNDASVYPGALEVCDGKDNDCDGQIDENNGNCPSGQTCTSGQCVNNCVPEYKTFSNSDIYYGSVAPPYGTGYYADEATAKRICELEGYTSLSSWTPQYNFYFSCWDNSMWRWETNKFITYPACSYNVGVDSVTCYRDNCAQPCIGGIKEYKTFFHQGGGSILDLTGQNPNCRYSPTAETANKVCQEMGYDGYSKIDSTRSFFSCYDNCIDSWTGGWQTVNACSSNNFIEYLTCYKGTCDATPAPTPTPEPEPDPCSGWFPWGGCFPWPW